MKIKSIVIAIALVAFSVTSCDKYLDEKLVSDVAPTSYYSNAAGIEDAVEATYSFMKYIWTNERSFSMTTFGTDTHTNGADGGYKAFNYYDGTLASNVDILQQIWDNLYRGINQANAVIERAPLVTDMPAATITIRQAEARFLRALYYFYLVRTWGAVPLHLEEVTEALVKDSPSTEVAIYDAIVADLEFAIANLPATAPAQYGRAWKAPAEFLLGQALATRSYRSYAKTDDVSRAEGLFTSVITNYGFALEPGLDKLFNQDNQKNKEVVFAIQYSTDAILNGPEGNRGHLYFLFEYDTQPGMIRDIANGRPFKRFRPTKYLLDLYAANRPNDLRYEQTYKHIWISNNAGTIPAWTAADVTAGAKNANGTAAVAGQKKYAVGDTCMYIPGPGNEAKWTAAQKAKTRYRIWTTSDFNEKIFPTLNKHIDPKRPTIQWEPGSRDMFLMRLADAYLLRAEMRLKQGNIPGTTADVNVLRTRSARPGRVAENQVTDAQMTLDFLLDERAMEFDGEQFRWFDLTRTNKLVQRAKLNPQVTGIKDHHVRRPIPQSQIDRSQGGYPQNCGYPNGPATCAGG
ncbi:MAG TPA: RagB/SusD family nutrient uptake outer membrane protein [Cyclobacteriaceae bacterium]|nr:RagB/SusD family nutrient uptake outer membrane protein [Cyclobacteriaceae bacterium]